VADLEAVPTDELVVLYRDAGRIHGEATMSGDNKVGNPKAVLIADVYRELRRRGTESVLAVLLDDPDPGVRAWAGAHALEFAPDEGEPVLEALEAGGYGPISFSAEMTLEVWRDGELRFS
jgi:Domain of unknown function (DUF2019)